MNRTPVLLLEIVELLDQFVLDNLAILMLYLLLLHILGLGHHAWVEVSLALLGADAYIFAEKEPDEAVIVLEPLGVYFEQFEAAHGLQILSHLMALLQAVPVVVAGAEEVQVRLERVEAILNRLIRVI